MTPCLVHVVGCLKAEPWVVVRPSSQVKRRRFHVLASFFAPHDYATAKTEKLNIGRPRPSGHSHGHGGMLVLSRPRAQVARQKGSRHAVPPPMNFPSLRREHRANDRAVRHAVGGGNTVSAVGSGSRSFGWSKLPPENTSISYDGDQVGMTVDSSSRRSVALSVDSTWGAALPPSTTVNLVGDSRDRTRCSSGPWIGWNVYMPPAARASLVNNGAVTPVSVTQQAEKSVVLKGKIGNWIHFMRLPVFV